MDPRHRVALAEVLRADIESAQVLHGGDVAEAFRVELDDERVVFAKFHADAPPEFFTTEAAGLEWLRSCDTVRVPRVVAVSDVDPAFLVLEWIPTGIGPADEVDFGRALAELHRSGAPSFGRQDRRTTGSRRLPNEPTDTWAEFYAENRLLPLAGLAARTGALAPDTVAGLERIAGRLDGLAPGEPPARLHGDLWAGNRVADASGRSWLIDPAAHGGHREFDLAMMRLFGGFDDGCFAAYHESYPLEAGWEDRLALHQLAPLAVHAIKFGGGYRDATAAAVARYV